MTDQGYVVLVADPDSRVRAMIHTQLAGSGCTVLEAPDGDSALKILLERDVRVVLSELYLRTGEEDDLIRTIRGNKALRRTRALAHTSHATAVDREWALRIGADAYLIKPVRAARLKDVVVRVANGNGRSGAAAPREAPITRRDSLDAALAEMEQGRDHDIRTIVFGRDWWSHLSRAQQSGYRKRAKQAGVSLRSDSLLSDHFVEVRGSTRMNQGLSTEQPESPYRR